MATYRVSVSYLVEVVDEEALLGAGLSAWRAPVGGWAVRAREDGTVVEATAEEVAAERPGPEASIALVLGQQGLPAVPGLRFDTMGVDVVPGGSEPVPGG